MKSFLIIAAMPMVMLAQTDGCNGVKEHAPKSIQKELDKTEAQQTVHLKTTPPPTIQTSQERKNLIERLKRFNTDSKVSYIYLVNYGKVMAFYTVKGKVSSVNSLLTQPSQPVWEHRRHSGGSIAGVVIPSPDLDGSYGSNGDAIFFFTTDGAYVEWRGDYMLCDKPLKLSTPPTMVVHTDE